LWSPVRCGGAGASCLHLQSTLQQQEPGKQRQTARSLSRAIRAIVRWGDSAPRGEGPPPVTCASRAVFLDFLCARVFFLATGAARGAADTWLDASCFVRRTAPSKRQQRTRQPCLVRCHALCLLPYFVLRREQAPCAPTLPTSSTTSSSGIGTTTARRHDCTSFFGQQLSSGNQLPAARPSRPPAARTEGVRLGLPKSENPAHVLRRARLHHPEGRAREPGSMDEAETGVALVIQWQSRRPRRCARRVASSNNRSRGRAGTCRAIVCGEPSHSS
jgi:hypothetical protein